MRQVAEHAYFLVCRGLGWLLRSARYSKAWIVDGRQVRKHRLFYAPLLIWMGGPLVRLLDTGVRVLPQREWEARERHIYWRLYNASIRIDDDGTLTLPCLAGETLAAVLEDRQIGESARTLAIARAVIALVELHRRGLTHGDAMAENVMVDRFAPASKREAGAARWFDFETTHESNRPWAWRRADDVRALAVTCLVRTVPEKRADTLDLIRGLYEDEEVIRIVAASFSSVWRRSLIFHLAQAGLSLRCFKEIGRRLSSTSMLPISSNL
jgi:hypothetical protein